MTLRSCLTSLIVLAALICVAPAAFAEDEPQGNDIRAKIKAQMEKILKLMKENEDALIQLSAGSSATTRKVDVKVDSPDGESGTSAGSKEDPSSKGEAVGKKLDELLKAHAGSGSIPPELEELVRMIPT